MILVDANLLLYATIANYPQHPVAADWLKGRLNGSARVGLPWASLVAFLRVATNPRAMAQPLSTPEAWKAVRRWLDRDVVWTPAPGERHAAILDQMLQAPGVHANLVHDADLAALAIEHGLELCSADGDFARFTGLRWTNPLRPER